MSKVINLTLHRRMRLLQRAANYLGSGRFLSKGRTQGKSMSVEDIIALSEEGRETPWIYLGGRAEDMRKQLPTAIILPFPGGRV